MRNFFWLALLGGCGGDPALEARVAKLEAEVTELRGRVVSKREKDEEAVVGKDAIFQAERWVQGESSLEEGKATVLVFWEAWCPHCKREVPKLQASYDKLHEQGLNVIGVTQLTRGVDEPKLKAFIEENHLTFPIAKDDGTLGKHYAVSGIPAVAIVKDGKVVWRGNPANLNDSMLAATIQ